MKSPQILVSRKEKKKKFLARRKIRSERFKLDRTRVCCVMNYRSQNNKVLCPREMILSNKNQGGAIRAEAKRNPGEGGGS